MSHPVHNPPTLIGAVHVDVRPTKVIISVEVDNKWVVILEEANVLNGGHISHIIEANGIRARAEKAA